ncbi:DoxX family protein [Lysobacter sp. KIS68-7]|uniref:DoxX family protein n=1 Tax=Lysobacter sp. KIS68-7 TaxID=2904252 RepID=UPI001E398393|nr:DoxX family protein [Lysobacter sp. KIS68-7]UHQ19422.1 DoxX family protein [Lysobacter sp. KIS68-7]
MAAVIAPTQAAVPAASGLGLALLRTALAAMWISHALLKLLVFTLPGTALFFEAHGIPGGLAYIVFPLEIFGGVALLFGVYARQVALALIPILLGALAVHLPNGWVFTATGGGWEYPMFLIVASLVLWLSGDGAFALRRSEAFVPRAIR